MLGFLPMFHSFGINVTGLLPLETGLRVVHHPDPTDAGGLARKIAAYKPTMLVGTPTFLIRYPRPRQTGSTSTCYGSFSSARRSVRSDVRALCRLAPHSRAVGRLRHHRVLAGRCSQPAGPTRSGTVGKPLPGVELLVLDLDADKPRGARTSSAGCWWRADVFPGYIGDDGPLPFMEIDGKRWYVTGDLAKIDDDGFMHFAGRMKRFLKAGGEMISLPALEEPFTRQYPPTKDGPRVAVEGRRTPVAGGSSCSRPSR